MEPAGQRAVPPGQSGHAEQHHEHAREQREAGEHGRPVALEEAPAGREQAIGLVAAERERREDPQQRQNEADVEQQQQREVPRGAESRADDRGDRGEIRERGRQLDRGDRRAEDPARPPVRVEVGRVAPATAASDGATAVPRRRSSPRPTAISTTSVMWWWRWGSSGRSSCPAPIAIAAPPRKYTAKTANVNSATRPRARSPVARYSAGAIVLGLSESASPIETTMPIRRSMRALSTSPHARWPTGERSLRRPLGEVQLLVLVVGEGSLARRAPPARLHRRAADRVPGRGRALGVAGPPAREQPERAGQLLAGGAQLVDEPGWSLGVRAGHHQRVALELAQALGEDVGGDPGDLLLEIAEPPRLRRAARRPPAASSGRRRSSSASASASRETWVVSISGDQSRSEGGLLVHGCPDRRDDWLGASRSDRVATCILQVTSSL